jgi:hypothetical protein
MAEQWFSKPEAAGSIPAVRSILAQSQAHRILAMRIIADQSIGVHAKKNIAKPIVSKRSQGSLGPLPAVAMSRNANAERCYELPCGPKPRFVRSFCKQLSDAYHCCEKPINAYRSQGSFVHFRAACCRVLRCRVMYRKASRCLAKPRFIYPFSALSLAQYRLVQFRVVLHGKPKVHLSFFRSERRRAQCRVAFQSREMLS